MKTLRFGKYTMTMEKKVIITIDLTKDDEDIFKQIEEASAFLNKPKKTVWQRIKSWF